MWFIQRLDKKNGVLIVYNLDFIPSFVFSLVYVSKTKMIFVHYYVLINVSSLFHFLFMFQFLFKLAWNENSAYANI